MKQEATLLASAPIPGLPRFLPQAIVPSKVGLPGPQAPNLTGHPTVAPTNVPIASRKDIGKKNTQPKPSPKKR